MGIREIRIINNGDWWTMVIDYSEANGQFGCSRPSLSEILEELEWRAKS